MIADAGPPGFPVLKVTILEVPVPSADAERAFSTHNKHACSSRLSLPDESVRVLHSAAWNGDIVVDLKAMTIKFYEVSRSPKVGLPISGNLGVRMSRVKSRLK